MILYGVLIASLLAATPSPGQTDGVVAAIDYYVITLSMLQAYRAEFAMEQPAAIALESLIDDRLLAIEARRYGINVPQEEQKAESARHPRPEGFTAGEWGRLIANHQLARRFLDFRFGDFVPIPSEYVKTQYDAHRDLFPGTFEAEEPRIRTRLAPAARSRVEESFKGEVRRRARVQINAPLLPAD